MTISRLHLITMDDCDYSHFEQVEMAIEAGADWIQLRTKSPNETWQEEVQECMNLCKEKEVTLLINDDLTMCHAVKANGVHVGPKDLHPTRVRNTLGGKKIVGSTINNLDHADDVKEWKVSNYAGVGPFRFTSTKENLAPILEAIDYEEIIAKLDIPVVAIGGILPEDVPEIKKRGCHGIAVAGGVFASEDPVARIQEYLKALEVFA